MSSRRRKRIERRQARAYASLLRFHPDWWRRRHGGVVIGTLQELHAATGRRRPGLADRVVFALDGVSVALLAAVRPSTRAPVLAPLIAAGHVFDQSNGALPDRFVGEREQTRANAAALRDSDEQRVAAVAFAGMNAIGR